MPVNGITKSNSDIPIGDASEYKKVARSDSMSSSSTSSIIDASEYDEAPSFSDDPIGFLGYWISFPFITFFNWIASFFIKEENGSENGDDVGLEDVEFLEDGEERIPVSDQRRVEILEALLKENSRLKMLPLHQDCLEFILKTAAQETIGFWDLKAIGTKAEESVTAHPLSVVATIILRPGFRSYFDSFRKHHKEELSFQQFLFNFAWYMGKKAMDDLPSLQDDFIDLLVALELEEEEKERLQEIFKTMPPLTKSIIDEYNSRWEKVSVRNDDLIYSKKWEELLNAVLDAGKLALRGKVVKKIATTPKKSPTKLRIPTPASLSPIERRGTDEGYVVVPPALWKGHIESQLKTMDEDSRAEISVTYFGVDRIHKNTFFKENSANPSPELPTFVEFFSFIVKDAKKEIIKIKETWGKQAALENRLVATSILLPNKEGAKEKINGWLKEVRSRKPLDLLPTDPENWEKLWKTILKALNKSF